MNGSCRDKRILIVDDTPENIRILGDLLKSEYRISLAITGEKALKIATAEPHPDLILLDIMMPGIDGFEVCERLKRVEHTRHIPIIFITAKNEREDEERGYMLGAADYIRKPFSTVVVKAKVKMQMEIAVLKRELDLEQQARAGLEKSVERSAGKLDQLEKELEKVKWQLQNPNETPVRREMNP